MPIAPQQWVVPVPVRTDSPQTPAGGSTSAVAEDTVTDPIIVIEDGPGEQLPDGPNLPDGNPPGSPNTQRLVAGAGQAFEPVPPAEVKMLAYGVGDPEPVDFDSIQREDTEGDSLRKAKLILKGPDRQEYHFK